MILVISNEDDISCDQFIEWCRYLNVNVLRVNESESINITDAILLGEHNQITFKINDKIININEIDSVWFRRGFIGHANLDIHVLKNKSIRKLFINESNTLTEYIIYSLKNKKSLNSPFSYNANKLITLYTAKKLGLNIPETLITTNINDVEDKFHNSDIITKTIQDALPVKKLGNNVPISPLTTSTKEFKDIKHFYYSKFQEIINAKYELRIFFINKEYYSIATFYSIIKRRSEFHFYRAVPYTLPDYIVNNLIELNKILEYESGSIDMIVTHDLKYYFLEINPVGQYDYMSKVFNYQLDYKLLEYLIN